MDHWFLDYLFEKGTIDKVDRAILQELIADSRQSTQSIADKARVSRPTAHDRIKKLVERGLISRFTTEINYFVAGLPIRAYIKVKFDSHLAGPELKQKSVAKLLSKIQFVRKVSIITGPYDFLVEAWIDDMRTLADVIIDEMRDIPGISQTETMIMFDEYSGGRRTLPVVSNKL